jgi:hypothetical protein
VQRSVGDNAEIRVLIRMIPKSRNPKPVLYAADLGGIGPDFVRSVDQTWVLALTATIRAWVAHGVRSRADPNAEGRH